MATRLCRDRADDRSQLVTDVALPSFYDHPSGRLETRAIACVALVIELELSRPEVGIGFREVWVAARAVMPVAAVHKNGQLAARIRDIGAARRLLPVQAIAAEAGLSQCAAKA